MDDEAVDR